MASPTYSGLTQVTFSGTDFAFAGTTADYPSSSDAIAFVTIDEQAGDNDIRIAGSSGTGSGDLVVAQNETVSLDLTNQKILFSARVFQSNQFDSDGLQFGYVDNLGVYNVFFLGNGGELAEARNFGLQNVPFMINTSATAEASNGTIDLTNIDTLLIAFKVTSSNISRPDIREGEIFTYEFLVVENGDVATPANFFQLSELLAANSIYPLYSLGMPGQNVDSSFFECHIPIKIQAEYWFSSGETVKFMQQDFFNEGVASGHHQILFEPTTTTAIQRMTDALLFSSVEVDVIVSASANLSAEITITDCTFNMPGDTEIRSPASLIGGRTGAARTNFIYHDGSVESHTVGDTVVTQIHCTPGQDLSSVGLTLEGTDPRLTLIPDSTGASVINFGGIRAANTIDLRNSTANAIAVQFDSSVGVSTTNNTGGAITVETVALTVTLNGIPDVANALIYVKNDTTEVITNPTVTSGTATFNAESGTTYTVRADAPGYLASNFITVNPANVTEVTFDLTDYRSLYDSGIARPSDLVFDPVNFTVTVADTQSSYSFPDIFRTLEDYLATTQGIAFTAHPYPVQVSGKDVLFFPYDTMNSQVNPVKILPHSNNTSDPTLDCEVFLQPAPDGSGVDDSTYDLFDFTTLGTGRIIRVRTSVAIANVNVSGGLSTADRAVLDGIAVQTTKVDGLIEDSSGNRFTTKALEQAPSGGGGDANAANQTTIINHLIDIKGGTFNASTDSLEAIRDRGDTAWTTATGFSTHTANDVFTLIDAQLSDIDTAIAAIPTNPMLAGSTVTANITQVAGVGVTGVDDFKAESVSGTIDANVIQVGGSAVSSVADFRATGFSTHTANDVFDLVNPRFTVLDTAIAAIPTNPILSGSTVSANIVQVAGSAISGISDFRATGFSTHSAGDVFNLVNAELNYIDTAIANIYDGGTVQANITQVAGAAINDITEFRTDVSTLETQVEEIHTFRNLNATKPISRDKNGSTATDTDGTITITHTIDEVNETVVSQRSG